MVVRLDPGVSPSTRVFQLALEQAPFPVEVLDSQGVVLSFNSAYAQGFVEEADGCLGQVTKVLPARLSDGRSREAILGAAQKAGIWHGEIGEISMGSRRVPMRLRVLSFQPEGDTSAPAYMLTYEDIGDEVRAREATTHQSNLAAVRSRQAQMSELLSMIAHQWRQPLTVVMSLIGNIQLRAQLGGVDLDYLLTKLERMSESIEFLSETIDSFRSFYAPTKYKSEEDVAYLTRKGLELVLPSLQKIGVKVQVSFPDVPLRTWVFAGEFLQVVLELLTNARDALGGSDHSPRRLHISMFLEAGYGVLRIANNGGEIPPEVMPHIYEPYYTTKVGAAGTGLGLYMARLIIENHHSGTLAASSKGGWTEFTCRLPQETR